MTTTARSWDSLTLNSPFEAESSDDVARGSVHDTLVDAVYFGIDKLKSGIKRQVYNDKGFDLPELSFVDVNAASNNGERALDKHLEITSGGRERDYYLHIPPGYNGSRPMPLVVVLHGLGQDGEKIADLSKMSEKADQEGFIVAYPNATKWLGAQKLRSWDVDNGVQIPGTDSNDVGFIRDMVAAIKDNLNIDSNRVYATGFSNGGMLAYRLASEMSDTFSAVAVVSGGASGKEAPPAKAVSVMAIHGTRDSVIPIDGLSASSGLVALGLPNFQSFRDSFRSWANNAGIQDKPEVDRNHDRIKARSVNPETGAEIIAYLIREGGHEWPGSERARSQNPESAEASFPATDKIWDFFKSNRRDQKQETTDQESALVA